MGYEVDDAHQQALAAEPEARSVKSWGYSAMGLALFGLLVPAAVLYFVFPLALVVTIFAVNKGSRLAAWAWFPLAFLGASLIYTTFVIAGA